MDEDTSKVEVLSVLSEQGEVKAAEVAAALDITYEATAMALLRAYRAGLVARSGMQGTEVFRYALTDKGWERLQYLAAPSRSRQTETPSTSHRGDSDMRIKKFHSGLHHCRACLYEVELTAETSLKCEDCGARLLPGPLPEPEEDDEDDHDEDDEGYDDEED